MASIKKEQTAPTFAQQVAKQRAKNNGISKNDRVDDAVSGAEALRQIVSTYKELKSANYGRCRQGLINAPNTNLGAEMCTDLDKAVDKLDNAIDKFEYELSEIMRLKGMLEEDR